MSSNQNNYSPLPPGEGLGVRAATGNPAIRVPEIEFEIKEFVVGVMATFAQREGLNVGVNGLLAYIQAHPGQRAGEMAVAFNLTQRTIERWLKQLKEKGSTEFRGAPKTGGYYRI